MPHRYFTTEIADGTAVLRGTDAHHLARVMRARMGDTVILCDGNAVEYTATITGFGDDCVEFSVEPGYPSAAEPSVEVTLLAGYPKQDKLEQIIKHGVELGAAVAEGVDIDPVAVRTAGENAALNGVQDKLTVLVGDLSDKASGKYDIITANIVANAILSLAPAVPGLMADGATFIASGIIDSRKDEVLAGLEAAGLAVVEVKEKRGWECIICKK